MMRPRISERAVRRRANEVIDELEMRSYPIDPEWIASERSIGIETWPQFPMDCYGALIREDDITFRIAVWEGCPTAGHRRFTIAHELGHYHLDGHLEAMLWSGSIALSKGGNYRGKDPCETEADQFASELLMPERWVRPIIDKSRCGVSTIQRLAAAFNTSLSCAAIRFVALTSEPVAVVLSKGRVIEWATFSRSFDGLPWIKYHSWKGEWAPRRSATFRLVQDPGAVSAGLEDGREGLLCEWFENAPQVLDVVEEAVGLGRYGRVLTVLSCPNLDDCEMNAFGEDTEESGDDPLDWRDAMRGYRLG